MKPFSLTRSFGWRSSIRAINGTRALEVEASLGEITYVTTEAVLTEVLTFFCEYGSVSRTKAVQTVELILHEDGAEVINVSPNFSRRLEIVQSAPG